MPRIRSVHPDICTDERLADVSAHAERLFVRLWTHLDDEGRCIDNPKLLKAALFPLHDDVDTHHVALWVDELIEAGCLFRYEAVDKSYLTAKRSWKVWQKPRHPAESKFPAPPDQVFTADRRTVTADRREPHAVVVVEGSCVGVGAEGECEGEKPPHEPAARTGDQRQERLAAAAEIIGERAATRPETRNPTSMRRAVAKGVITDRHTEAYAIIAADPSITAADLAEQLEPTPPVVPEPYNISSHLLPVDDVVPWGGQQWELGAAALADIRAESGWVKPATNPGASHA